MSGDRNATFDKAVLERLSAEELSLDLAEEAAETSYDMLCSGATSAQVGPVTDFVMGMDDSDAVSLSEGEREAPSDLGFSMGPSDDEYDFGSLPF